MSNCPVYSHNRCILKTLSNPEITSVLFNLPLIKQENWLNDCGGFSDKCSFRSHQEVAVEPQKEIETIPQEQTETPTIKEKTKISIHKVEQPFMVKADVLVYPTNVLLNIDSPLLNRMTRGNVQNECDAFKKPIKMGGVYITSNGGELSRVQAQKIFHVVVAGESRLVNEEDIKISTRKSLHLAENIKARNIVMIPADCGTHDINDTARVQLSAIKTYLQTNPHCSLANIFVVMEDEESYQTYNEYYNRIFKR